MDVIPHVLQGCFVAQSAGLRSASLGLFLLSMAASVAVLSLGLAFAASVWALSLVMAAWQASAIMACVAMISVLVPKVFGVRMIRRGTCFTIDSVPALKQSNALLEARPAAPASETVMLLGHGSRRWTYHWQAVFGMKRQNKGRPRRDLLSAVSEEAQTGHFGWPIRWLSR